MIESDFMRYVEFFNPSKRTSLQNFQIRGLFEGTITSSQIVEQGTV